MRKSIAVIIGVLVATLTMSGIGQAQGVTTVQGTIQAVDCQTSAIAINAPDGTHVFPAGPHTTAFVNSAPIGFCGLRQYVGSSATVSVAPYANLWVAERVDVYVAAAQPPQSPAPTYSSVPSWLGIVLGTVIVGGLVYLLVRGHDGAVHRYPYSGPHGPYGGGPYYGPADRYPHQYDPYHGGPYPYGYGPSQYGPYGQYQQCADPYWGRGCTGREPGDNNR